MYSNFVILYARFFQFVITPFTIYANYKQLALIKKNKKNGSFSKMFSIFFIYSCFFNILYYFKNKYDLVFLIRAVFFIIFQTLILLRFFENKKNEDLDFLRKEIEKEEININDKKDLAEKNNVCKSNLDIVNKKDDFIEIKLELPKDEKTICKFKENKKNEILKKDVEFEKNQKKLDKLIKTENLKKMSENNSSKKPEKTLKKKQTEQNKEKIEKIKNKITLEKLFFFKSTLIFFSIYTLIFIFTNNPYFIEMTGFLTMLESLTGIVQILKINKKKNLKSISFIFILNLFFENFIEGIYFFFKSNPIWFQIENYIIFFSHFFLIFQLYYFRFYEQKNLKRIFVEEILEDLEKGLERDFDQ